VGSDEVSSREYLCRVHPNSSVPWKCHSHSQSNQTETENARSCFESRFHITTSYFLLILAFYISPHSNIERMLSAHQHFRRRKRQRQNNVRILPVILTVSFGLLFGPVGTFSILRRVRSPSMTFPNTTWSDMSGMIGSCTFPWASAERERNAKRKDGKGRKRSEVAQRTCLPSKKSHAAVVMKN